MRISDEEIWEKRTEAAKLSGVGAWSKKQLKEWGVPWPPPRGWRAKLNGGINCEASRTIETPRRASCQALPEETHELGLVPTEWRKDLVIEILNEMEMSDDQSPPW